jgi:poly(ADP-ribose) glycohydrolase ARH3
MVARKKLRDKFLGSLIGAALGDAIGASREGHRMASEEEIGRIPEIQHPLRYTDDTHMTIGMAESLLENRGFNGAHLAERFAENYFKEPWRGYGPGPPRVFRLLKNGEAWDKAAGHVYQGGSFGNGAAMRVAPVGARGRLPKDKGRMLKDLEAILAQKDPSMLRPEYLRGL